MLSTHLQDLDSDFHNATSTGPPICAEGMQQKGMCYTFWILWAVGGRALQMPPEAGMPMGKASLGDVSTARSVMLEVHYDNPGKEQIIDQSGFRLYYTDQLRAHDAVILTLGHVNIVGTQLVRLVEVILNLGPCSTGDSDSRTSQYQHPGGRQVARACERMRRDVHAGPLCMCAYVVLCACVCMCALCVCVYVVLHVRVCML